MLHLRRPRVSHCPARRGRARAFTLLEVLIVLSLLVLLVGLSWPALSNRLNAAQLPETADRFRSLLYLTRSAAMMDHMRYRIRFVQDVQQPVIEFEPDAIGRPGEYVESSAEWAAGFPLPDNVHVHDVIPGRPAYLTPVSANPPEEEVGVETTTDLNEQNAGASDAATSFVDQMKDEGADARRPGIVFETDGTADWATIVLSELPASEALDGSQRQYWVVLDGRTGLATVREGITEEELATREFSVPREKLLLPKTTDTHDLAFNISSGGDGSAGAGLQGLGGLLGGANGLQGMGAGMQGAANNSQQPTAAQPVAPNSDAANPLQNPLASNDPMAELEKQLASSGLSEDEKEQIRNTFREQQNTGSVGAGGQGSKGG